MSSGVFCPVRENLYKPTLSDLHKNDVGEAMYRSNVDGIHPFRRKMSCLVVFKTGPWLYGIFERSQRINLYGEVTKNSDVFLNDIYVPIF